jgi:hypothetical protein
MRIQWRYSSRIAACSLGFVLQLICNAHLSAVELRRLEFHGQANVARVERFVAAEVFVVGNRIGGRALGGVSFNFERNFLGVVETGAKPVSLQSWALRYSADDAALIGTLGGEDKATLPLSSIHRLMEMGESGGSHADWRSNIAYARAPSDGKLWAIHWTVGHGGDWVIGAAQVPHSDLEWASGTRVFGPAEDRASTAKLD